MRARRAAGTSDIAVDASRSRATRVRGHARRSRHQASASQSANCSTGPEPLKGLRTHLVIRRPQGLRYIDVWESKEACDRAFAERIHPAVFGVFQEIGFRPQGEPTRELIEVVDQTTGAPR